MKRVRSLRGESLESRRLLASLGLDIQLLADDGGVPGGALSQPEQILHGPLQVGDAFWLRVVAWDGRTTAAGVVSLPLNLQWDPQVLRLDRTINAGAPVPLEDPLLTEKFPQLRGVTAVDEQPGAFRIDGLRAAASPTIGVGEAIGVGSPEEFSLLQFTALQPADATPFQIELAGSMSFADAQQLQTVFHLVDGAPVEAEPPNETIDGPFVRELIQVEPAEPETAGIAGAVFVDADFDGRLDRDSSGRPVEVGLANIQIDLFRRGEAGEELIATTRSGADGWYEFTGLEPGEYRIRRGDAAGFLPGGGVPGAICDEDDCLLPEDPRLGQGELDAITGVMLQGGDQAVDYDFAMRMTAERVNKRMYLTKTTRSTMSCDLSNVSCAIVNGTPQDDELLVETLADRIVVQVNDRPPRAIPRQESPPLLVIVDGGGGTDQVTIAGGPEPEAALVTAGAAILQDVNITSGGGEPTRETWTYGVATDRFEAARLVLVDDNDRVLLLDGPLDDALDVEDSAVSLSQAALGLTTRADGPAAVHAVSRLGGDDRLRQAALIDFLFASFGRWNDA